MSHGSFLTFNLGSNSVWNSLQMCSVILSTHTVTEWRVSYLSLSSSCSIQRKYIFWYPCPLYPIMDREWSIKDGPVCWSRRREQNPVTSWCREEEGDCWPAKRVMTLTLRQHSSNRRAILWHLGLHRVLHHVNEGIRDVIMKKKKFILWVGDGWPREREMIDR